ncbi:MAG: universal stress protein [Bacteroidetes bacterium]|nr:universal stress protein [Bacteroidota bacterium]
MKKMIAAFDGLKYAESTAAFAIQMAKLSQAHLVGIFLEDFTYRSFPITEFVGNEGLLEQKMKMLEEKDRQTRFHSVEAFERACQDEKLRFSVHHDKGIAIHELLHETIYADLLIINSNENFTRVPQKMPSRFMSELLVNINCPVLLVPDFFKPFEKIIFLYNGEPSSVHATKMFSYMFPSLAGMEAEVLSVRPQYESLHLPDNRLMKEFMKRHFPNASYTVLQGSPENEIARYLQKLEKPSLVVLGAYSRNMVSRWFRISMGDVLIRELKLPLFIAHS